MPDSSQWVLRMAAAVKAKHLTKAIVRFAGTFHIRVLSQNQGIGWFDGYHHMKCLSKAIEYRFLLHCPIRPIRSFSDG